MKTKIIAGTLAALLTASSALAGEADILAHLRAKVSGDARALKEEITYVECLSAGGSESCSKSTAKITTLKVGSLAYQLGDSYTALQAEVGGRKMIAFDSGSDGSLDALVVTDLELGTTATHLLGKSPSEKVQDLRLLDKASEMSRKKSLYDGTSVIVISADGQATLYDFKADVVKSLGESTAFQKVYERDILPQMEKGLGSGK